MRKLKACLWAAAGNSRTMLVAYGLELAGAIDELKYYDWSPLVGSERAGRIVMFLGVVVMGLRFISRTAITFRPLTEDDWKR